MSKTSSVFEFMIFYAFGFSRSKTLISLTFTSLTLFSFSLLTNSVIFICDLERKRFPLDKGRFPRETFTDEETEGVEVFVKGANALDVGQQLQLEGRSEYK